MPEINVFCLVTTGCLLLVPSVRLAGVRLPLGRSNDSDDPTGGALLVSESEHLTSGIDMKHKFAGQGSSPPLVIDVANSSSCSCIPLLSCTLYPLTALLLPTLLLSSYTSSPAKSTPALLCSPLPTAMNILQHPTDDGLKFRPPTWHPAAARHMRTAPVVIASGRQPPFNDTPLCAAHGLHGCPTGAKPPAMHYSPDYGYHEGPQHPCPDWAWGFAALCVGSMSVEAADGPAGATRLNTTALLSASAPLESSSELFRLSWPKTDRKKPNTFGWCESPPMKFRPRSSSSGTCSS
jgi:hypothetical protein